MDHDTIDTMTVYRRWQASFETSDTIDALDTHQSLNRLILTALFDCFFSSFHVASMLQHVERAPWQLRSAGEDGQNSVTDPSLDDGCQGQSETDSLSTATSLRPCCCTAMESLIVVFFHAHGKSDSTPADSILNTL
jgi:hypothetical protein